MSLLFLDDCFLDSFCGCIGRLYHLLFCKSHACNGSIPKDFISAAGYCLYDNSNFYFFYFLFSCVSMFLHIVFFNFCTFDRSKKRINTIERKNMSQKNQKIPFHPKVSSKKHVSYMFLCLLKVLRNFVLEQKNKKK